MSTETFNVVFSMLAFVALAVAAATAIALLVPAGRSALAEEVGPDTLRAAAFAIATVATAGSLYYSQIAHFTPCELCWYQRICMYPLALLTGIAWWRRDDGVAWYGLPFAAVGAVIAGYHVLVERYPSLGEGLSCSLEAPCTVPWFRQWGFVTIAGMAFAGFVAVGTLLVAAAVAARRSATMETPVEEPA